MFGSAGVAGVTSWCDLGSCLQGVRREAVGCLTGRTRRGQGIKSPRKWSDRDSWMQISCQAVLLIPGLGMGSTRTAS